MARVNEYNKLKNINAGFFVCLSSQLLAPILMGNLDFFPKSQKKNLYISKTEKRISFIKIRIFIVLNIFFSEQSCSS